MTTKVEEQDGKWIATLEGEMDTAAAVEAEELLKPLYVRLRAKVFCRESLLPL